MPSMIETLIGSGIQRPDEKRIVPNKRPLPSRARDLLELFVVLDREASIPSLVQACDLRQADPRHISFITLGRWPTAEELQAQPSPYVVRQHLRALLVGEEFRTSLARRICDAYPERPRLLYVRIPRCAGQHFLATLAPMHPLIPEGLARWRENDQGRFIPALGAYLGRFNHTRTIQIMLTTLQPFIQAADPTLPSAGDKILPWSLNSPPCRVGDRLFTIVREPTGLMLSQVNAHLTALQAPPAEDTPAVARDRTRLGPLPPANDPAAWQAIGRNHLMTLSDRNPICHALGDGTAESALQACRMSDLEIADLNLYQDWIKYTWDVEPEPPSNTSSPIVTADQLDPEAKDHLSTLVGEDLAFYARVSAAQANLGELRTAIRGRDL